MSADLSAALDGAGVGTFSWDLRTGALTWDRQMLALFGVTEEQFSGTIEAFDAGVHLDDRAEVTAAVQGALDGLGQYEASYRVVHPSGEVRWLQARGTVETDEDGTPVRMVGVAYDTTRERTAEVRVQQVLESMPAGYVGLDAQWRVTDVNAAAERMLASGRDQLVGHVAWDLLQGGAGPALETTLRTAAATGEPCHLDEVHLRGVDRWFEVHAWPSDEGLAVYVLDVSARHAEREQAERDTVRAELLDQVTGALTSTLDAREAAGLLARLVVPVLADWAVVTLVAEEAGGSGRPLRDAGWYHRDADLAAPLRRYATVRLSALAPDAPLLRCLDTGRRVELRQGASKAIADTFTTAEARDLVAELAPESLAVLPLRASGRTLGLLTFARGAERAPLVDGDLELAVEVAGRAGLALDNARLYAEQRDLAQGLQRSLLTEPPEPDHGQIVVRYAPAAEAAQVGGDWYDAFLQAEGATVLVIGDVIGHDTVAAAAMGQLRGLLRGIAATTGDGPAEVLRRLDTAMELLQIDTSATVVVARLEQTPEEHARNEVRLRWSSAGHPPPLVLTPAGELVELAAPGDDPDLLLGVEPSAPRTEAVVTLPAGSTVLMFTDGLVERRGQSLDEGLARLRATVVSLADRTLDELCDETLRQMLPERAEDDVALVSVRVHDQHKPRPYRAGRNRLPDSVAPPLC